jgi:putative methionine-R-sulfoxide reductase with GAF domain
MDQTVARSVEQNARLHAMVRDIARQVKWAGDYMTEEAWKRVLLAAKYGQKIVPNPFTGIGMVVVNEKRSRDLSVEEMSEFIGEIEAFGASQGVDWSEDE